MLWSFRGFLPRPKSCTGLPAIGTPSRDSLFTILSHHGTLTQPVPELDGHDISSVACGRTHTVCKQELWDCGLLCIVLHPHNGSRDTDTLNTAGCLVAYPHVVKYSFPIFPAKGGGRAAGCAVVWRELPRATRHGPHCAGGEGGRQQRWVEEWGTRASCMHPREKKGYKREKALYHPL